MSLIGIDTTFLVQLEVSQDPSHAAARNWLEMAVGQGHRFALAPQVLAEFIHVGSDAKRFANPLTVPALIARAEAWWTADEVVPVHPTDAAVRQFLVWSQQHRLGRKRLLDTLLAATYHAHGVVDIVTSNARDFSLFGVFRIHGGATH